MTILYFLMDKILIAILVSLISSAVFLYILSRLKPKLEISPEIAKGVSTVNNRNIYRIKVINKSRQPVTDVRAQLHLLRSYQVKGGSIWKSKALELTRSDPMIIDKFDKNCRDVNYAYRFLTYDDIDEIWEDDTYQILRFRIICKNSLSGFGGFFSRKYSVKKQCIIDGDFEKGCSFKIFER